jgi:hypothetical protein
VLGSKIEQQPRIGLDRSDVGAVAHDAAVPHQRVEMLLGHEGTGTRIDPVGPLLEGVPFAVDHLGEKGA